jgi:hypothetical protein
MKDHTITRYLPSQVNAEERLADIPGSKGIRTDDIIVRTATDVGKLLYFFGATDPIQVLDSYKSLFRQTAGLVGQGILQPQSLYRHITTMRNAERNPYAEN